jgi:hypothetical protein
MHAMHGSAVLGGARSRRRGPGTEKKIKEIGKKEKIKKAFFFFFLCDRCRAMLQPCVMGACSFRWSPHDAMDGHGHGHGGRS